MQDEVIPLSQPIETTTGEIVSEIPVGKGQMIHLSLCGYNRYALDLVGRCSYRFLLLIQASWLIRLKSVWGEDAHVFRPERWLEMGTESPNSFGIYSGLYVAFNSRISGLCVLTVLLQCKLHQRAAFLLGVCFSLSSLPIGYSML